MPVNRKSTRSAFFRGKDGANRLAEEQEYQKQKAEQRKAAANMPFRFYVPVGETRQYIICDDAPDFYMYEHALKDSEGRWGRLFSGCVKTFDNCPVCEALGRESYYALYLTVVDLTPFEMRDGTKVEFSRKLLVIKLAQQKKFLRLYEKHGTLRGALIEVTRDGDKDASIGNDIEFIEFVDEEEMEGYTRSWKDGDGKKHTENCDEPLVYEELFDEPDVDALRALVGGSHTPGSREADERELRGSRSPRGGVATARGAGRTRAGRGKDKDWEDAEDSSEYEAPARGSRRRGKTDDDEPPFDTEDDTPPPSTRRGRGRAEEPEPTRTRTGRRTMREEPEEPEEQEEAPRRRRGAPEPEPEEEPRSSRRPTTSPRGGRGREPEPTGRRSGRR